MTLCLFNKHLSEICHLQKSISFLVISIKELKAAFHGNEPSSSLSAATAASFSRLFPVQAVRSCVSDRLFGVWVVYYQRTLSLRDSVLQSTSTEISILVPIRVLFEVKRDKIRIISFRTSRCIMILSSKNYPLSIMKKKIHTYGYMFQKPLVIKK